MAADLSPLSRRALFRGAAAFAAASASALSSARARDFQDFLTSLRELAIKEGVAAATFERAAIGLSPDPQVLRRLSAQPEFETPIWDYVRRASGRARLARGALMATRWAAPLATIERRFGVPASIVLAAWGMEADFAQPNQTQDVVRSLATLSWARAGDASSRSEFVDALKILQIRDEPRADLTGSWAGAMGMPQFMPSTYLRFATSYRGGAPADIWRSEPDALCSIANFLRGSGWRPGLPWGIQAHAPAGFRWEALRAPFARWSALGFRAVGDRALPTAGDGSLFAPAGAKGPIFLLSDNFLVLKDYDNSDSYALALGLLADGLDGRPGPSVEWPGDARLLPLAQRARAQADLKRLGFYEGAADGKVGPATREAVHRFQRSAGLAPADGFLSQTVAAAAAKRAVRQR